LNKNLIKKLRFEVELFDVIEESPFVLEVNDASEDDQLFGIGHHGVRVSFLTYFVPLPQLAPVPVL
jgi:hypothetical protein